MAFRGAANQVAAIAPADLRPAYRRMWTLLSTSRLRLLALAACSTLSGFAQAAILYLLVRSALVIASRQHAAVVLPLVGSAWHPRLSELIAVAAALSGFWLLLQAVMVYLPARIGTDVLTSLRTETFASFVGASWAVQSKEEESDVVDTLTNQVVRTAQAALFFSGGLASLLSLVALTVAALLISPVAAAVVIVAVVVLFVVLRPLSVAARRLSAHRSGTSLRYAGLVTEAVRMTEEMQVFGVGEQEQRRVTEVVGEVAEPWFRAQFLNAAVPAAYQGATIVFVIAGLALAAAFGRGQVAALGAVILILFQALSYSQNLQSVYHSFNDTWPYAQRILDVQARYRQAARPRGGEEFDCFDTLEFRHVDFAYHPGHPVLHDVSFSVRSGETIGVVGPSGAGKSTMAQLLLRLRDPDQGDITMDGGAVARFDLTSWCARTTYVPQAPRLINASVADNIRFLRTGISDEEVVRVAKLAHIHDDIVSWPHGYDTRISDRVEAVSGGQGQRICLARALVRHPLLLVLDEPTSALDLRSEALVQKALAGLHGRVTMFVIAHRLSTLAACDRVMVIQDGRLEAFEPARVLVGSNPWYQEVFDLSQPGRAAADSR